MINFWIDKGIGGFRMFQEGRGKNPGSFFSFQTDRPVAMAQGRLAVRNHQDRQDNVPYPGTTVHPLFPPNQSFISCIKKHCRMSNEIKHAARVLSRYRDARRTRILRIRLRLTVRVNDDAVAPAGHPPARQLF